MFILSSAVFNAYVQSDFFGKMIFLGLFILSILSWMVLLYKIWQAKRVKRLSSQLEKLLSQKDQLLNANLEYSANLFHPFYQIFKILKQTTLDVLNKNRFYSEEEKVFLSPSDINLVESHIAVEISHQSKLLEKNLFILSTIVTLAPFLGLLGTVWGILVTFSNLQIHSLSSSNSAVLTGLSMALATTVLGLVVAIPALVSYNYLKHTIRDITKDMEIFSHRMVTTIEMQYRRVDVK